MRSRGTPEQGRDLGSVLWALRWTQRLREQLVQCEAPHVLKVKDLKETGSQNLGHPEAWACFRQCGRPGARTSRTWWPLGTPARAAAGWASPVWVSGLRAPGCGGHGRPLCPACCRPWTCPTPRRCCWRSASCVTVLSRRPGGRAGPEGVASDCCLLPEAPQRRGPLSPAQEPCGVSCVCRVGPA